MIAHILILYLKLDSYIPSTLMGFMLVPGIVGGLLRKSLIYKYNIEIEDKEEYER